MCCVYMLVNVCGVYDMCMCGMSVYVYLCGVLCVCGLCENACVCGMCLYVYKCVVYVCDCVCSGGI